MSFRFRALIVFLTWQWAMGNGQLLWALPVSNVQVAPRRGVTIATIDLEKVFQAYPETKKARGELEKLILIKENEIASKRAEIFRLKEDIAILKTKASLAASQAQAPVAAATPVTPPVVNSTETVSGSTSSVAGSVQSAEAVSSVVAPPAALLATEPPVDAVNAEIVQKEEEAKSKTAELKQLERLAEKNLEDLEQAKTKTILAKIYFTLRELAQEKNVDMIVDKNAILWGSSWLDLTDELIRKLKTVMIEKE